MLGTMKGIWRTIAHVLKSKVSGPKYPDGRCDGPLEAVPT